MDYRDYHIHHDDYQLMLETLGHATTFVEYAWHHSPPGSEMEHDAAQLRAELREMWATITRRSLARVAVAGAVTIAPPADQPA